jgi:peptidyl-prolyl cis-trans isomerase D
MATLENIRKRGPLVAIIIGFALFAFILGDLFNSGSSIFSGNQFSIATINGKDIDYRDYEEQVKETTENFQQNNNIQTLTDDQRTRIREAVWENMTQMVLLEGEYESIGLAISSDELFDLIQGRSVDPLVLREPAFSNPETGAFDPSRVVTIYKNMDQDESGNTKRYLLGLEKQVKENRRIRKYFSLVEKGLYYPNTLVEKDFQNRNYLVDIDYVGKSYTEIPDSVVSFTQSDLEKYYKEHKGEYEQEASRDIAYLTFDVIPSKKDTLFAKTWIDKLVKEFSNASDNKQFINFNSDIPFNPNHFKKGDIELAELDSFAFSADTGKLFGPYFENGSFKLAKLLKVTSIPDSIEAKHILIQINGASIPDMTKAKLIADSLKKVIAGGGDFAAIAKEFSADRLSLDNEGKLGWVVEGQNVNQMPLQPFDELLNKNANEVVSVEKPYGIHLLVKTGTGPAFKKVQVGIIERKIVPSTETFQKIYSDATKFAGANRSLKKFDDAIAQQGLIRRLAPGLSENGSFISGLENPRVLIRWAFNAKVGDVSEVFELGKRYVVGALTDIKQKGIAPLKQVEELVKMGVIKEKKAEMLVKEFKQHLPVDLPGLAQKLNSEVFEARNISFSSFQIPGARIGYEPLMIAIAVTSEKGKISEPIKGENGVYVLNVKTITGGANTENMDLSMDKRRLIEELQNRVYPNQAFGGAGQVLEALKKSAKIEDNRIKFF